MPEFEEIDTGDEFIICSYSRWADAVYSRPVKCVRTSPQQFAVENPYDDTGKPIRFTRKGDEIGGSRSIKRATVEFVKEVDTYHKDMAAEKAKKASEADAAEMALRDKYGATMITDWNAQKVLGSIRAIAEKHNATLERWFERVGEPTAEEPWSLIHQLDWDGRDTELKVAANVRNDATELHDRLVMICQQWYRGSSFKVSTGVTYDPTIAVSDLTNLLKCEIGCTIQKAQAGYFDHNMWEENQQTAEFISDLRDALDMRYTYESVRIVHPEDKEEAA